MTDGAVRHGEFDAILGLGSNVGDKIANLDRAISLLTGGGDIRLVARSRTYRSPPWGKTDQDWFANACIGVATELTADMLLARCQEAEDRMGRVRKERWGPRVIDVDILTYRNETVTEPRLMIPHPLLTERAFVLVPLADIAPELVVKGESVLNWLHGIGRSGVEPLD